MKRENNAIEPWIVFAASEKNDTIPTEVNNCDCLPFEIMLKYQLQVLLSRAQPDWPLLLKVSLKFSLNSTSNDIIIITVKKKFSDQ